MKDNATGEWPVGCIKPRSCERNRVCMYQGCRWQGTNVAERIDRAQARQAAQEQAASEGRAYPPHDRPQVLALDPAATIGVALAAFLPPGPYSYETTAPLEGHHGYGHVYLVDRDGRRLANIWGPPDQKLALAEFIIQARGAS